MKVFSKGRFNFFEDEKYLNILESVPLLIRFYSFIIIKDQYMANKIIKKRDIVIDCGQM